MIDFVDILDYFYQDMSQNKQLSRREFLKLSALALGGAALTGRQSARSLLRGVNLLQEDKPIFPEGQLLGRMCIGEPGANVSMMSEPSVYANEVRKVYFDEVLQWNREVIADQVDGYKINQKWVETPEGYIYADYMQKVRHEPQIPMEELPLTATGERGMWVEITTPYSGLGLTKPQENYQYWIRATIRPRVYYSQVFWAYDVRRHPDTGQVQYLLTQKYGALPDTYWVDANLCRQITAEEVAPIHPDAEDKFVKVDIKYQTMSCYEGDEEVYFAKVTTGGWVEEEDRWATPLGIHTIWRKSLSIHMSAGAAVGNYDIPGIPWATFFDANGAAFHSTFWHNYFGSGPRSHGCVNLLPEDAKWLYRWTQPDVPYEEGDIFISGLNKSTQVEVIAD
jgi:lipoprotein-anchoring transpeptidase ErfK/SrfK